MSGGASSQDLLEEPRWERRVFRERQRAVVSKVRDGAGRDERWRASEGGGARRTGVGRERATFNVNHQKVKKKYLREMRTGREERRDGNEKEAKLKRRAERLKGGMLKSPPELDAAQSPVE